MAQYKAEFIKVPTDVHGFQTMPTEPHARIADSDLTVELCDEKDAEKIVRRVGPKPHQPQS